MKFYKYIDQETGEVFYVVEDQGVNTVIDVTPNGVCWSTNGAKIPEEFQQVEKQQFIDETKDIRDEKAKELLSKILA